MIHWSQILPTGWRQTLHPSGPIGIGLDLATTAKEKSNPSSLAIVQKVGPLCIARVVVRWKTAVSEVTRRVLGEAINLPGAMRPRGVSIDATNERFFASDLRTLYASQAHINLVVSSENTEYKGETMSFKVFLGNLIINSMEEETLILPEADWLRADLRSVKRANGSFFAELAPDGGHGDAFDAVKLALYSLIAGGGPVVARAAQRGSNWQNSNGTPRVMI